MQLITFRDRDPLNLIVNDEDKKKTTLTEWLAYNKVHTDGQYLTYVDFLKEFVWYPDSKSWSPRKRKGLGSVGHLVYVHLALGELFYLQLLLCHQKGCKTFRDIRTVNKVVFNTFRAACEALGLLGDDKEWHAALEEASFSSTLTELRNLSVKILIFCDVEDPVKLWNTYWQNMSDDIPRTTSENLYIQNLYINDPELKGFVLYEVQIILSSYSKTLKDFGLPPLSKRLLEELRNKELMEEKSYNRIELAEEVNILKPKLNIRQRRIYDRVIDAATKDQQALIFIYGHGGTGKTFLWKVLINALRSEGKIVLVVASYGIASLLLLVGRTTHSRFKLPLDLTNDSICNIKKNTHNITLRDIMDVPDKVFGGKSVVLGGDFGQTLLVKKGGSKAEIIAASIAESHLWSHFKVYTLTENMRLQQPSMNDNQRQLSSSFATWLLDVGNGKIGTPKTDNNKSISWITILEEYYTPDTEDAMSKLINFIYDDQTLRKPNARELQQKAIICPRNNTTDIINSKIMSAVEGTSTIYKSSDEAIPVGNDEGEVELFTRQNTMMQNCISDLKPEARNKVLEARVYRKWITRKTSSPAPTDYSCFLIDCEWKSRIKRYIDTKPNRELIHYCLVNSPYELGWKDKPILDAEGNPTNSSDKVFETYKTVTQEIRDQLNAEAEAVQIILTEIDNDIYSTVDACPNASDFLNEMPSNALQGTSVAETQEEPWKLFTDSSSCVDGSGTGLILTNPDGIEFTYALRFQFAASNNEAEYEALIAANQVLGTYVAKEENMIKYLEIAKGLVSGFKTFSISQEPRSKNKKADALSKIASTSFAHLSKQVPVEVLETKSITGKEVTAVIEEEGPTWMTELVSYLKEGTLPANEKEARKIRLKARQYELMDGILYKRSFLTP
nr:DNA helicase [Tanacetum cinerariifolium]